MRRLSPARLSGALGVVVLALSGCGGVGTLYPVSGKVTLDGKPLPDGQVSFVPDKEKGNKAPATPFGKIKDGSYSLETKGQPGAPAGAYKIMVITRYPGSPEKNPELPKRYADAGNSGLAVEVSPTPAAGAYDLKLTSR
jgi:hypothetical protein